MIDSGCHGRERRQSPRFAVEFAVRMIDVDLKRINSVPLDTPCYETHFIATNVIGRNISEGGFAFESHRKPAASTVLGLQIALPQQEQHCTSAANPPRHYPEGGFRALGQVVWIAPLKNKYLAGVRFIDQNPRRSAALQELIALCDTRHHSSAAIPTATPDSLAQSCE